LFGFYCRLVELQFTDSNQSPEADQKSDEAADPQAVGRARERREAQVNRRLELDPAAVADLLQN
jgi:NAD(P)H-dependent flavin oxidoreductase YrpB (nitropropane dioxygenase family)